MDTSYLLAEGPQTPATPSASAAPRADRMKVYLRVRPFTTNELATCQACANAANNKASRCFSVDPGGSTLLARDPADAAAAAAAAGSEKVASRFAFTRVYDEAIGQSELYNSTVADIVAQLLSGGLTSGLVFNYGVTGSGKTYTIQGSPEAPGVLPRALETLFNGLSGRLVRWLPFRPASFNEAETLAAGELEAAAKEADTLLRSDPAGVATAAAWRRAVAASAAAALSNADYGADASAAAAAAEQQFNEDASAPANSKRYSVWVSYAEIYNEVVYDLLDPVSGGGLRSRKPSRPQLELRTDRTGSVYIRGLRCLPVSSAEEAYRLMLLGKQNQQVAATNFNQQSSRSHSLFAVRLVHCLNKPAPQFCQVSSLTFCDLAGSERQPRGVSLAPAAAAAAGERTREAGSINSSLLTLRRCVETLQHNQRHPKAGRLAPFRDSKLTRLIQPYFSGSGRAAMIVNISQCPALYDETVSALRFSALARSVVVSEPAPKRIRVAVTAAAAAAASPGYGVLSPACRDLEPGGLDVTYADEDEAEMADIAVMDRDALVGLIASMRASRRLVDEEMEARELRIRRELIGERDRLMADMEERFEQQLQQQRDSMMDSHEERLREYIGTSERLAERRLERFKQRMDGRVASLEEKLGEAKTKSDQQEITIANLTEQRDELLLRMDAVRSQLAEMHASDKGASLRQRLLEGNDSLTFSCAGGPVGDGGDALEEPLNRHLDGND